MIALVLLLAFQQPEIQEQEPNNEQEAATQTITADCTFVGSLPEGDEDWVWLECAEDTVCSLTLEQAADSYANLELYLPTHTVAVRNDVRPMRVIHVRFRGRTALHLSGTAPQYRLQIVKETPAAREEIEPDDSVEEAVTIHEQEVWRGLCSGLQYEHDFFALPIDKAGPREVVLRRDPHREHPIYGMLSLCLAGQPVPYPYQIQGDVEEFHFYPVLTEGTWTFEFALFGDPGDVYELSVLPFSPQVTDDERRAARAAIERATAYLLPPPADRPRLEAVIAGEGMVLAALSDGTGAHERRDTLERDYVAWLGTCLTKVEGDTWHGREVESFGESIYAHSMATLGLAEAVANGSERAKELTARGVEFLIATQNTERKPAGWSGPVPREALGYGGWRYTPKENNGDLSILGWCLVALTAADAVGVHLDGMREGATAALAFVEKNGDQYGFGYQAPGSRTNLHNAIGALLQSLYDARSIAFGFASGELDVHLWSATQVDTADQYPFYYLYYGTRAQYLKQGEAWRNWRAVALRQLLRRQESDGSWAALQAEAVAGPRWTTAIGVMVLRLCLDEAPRYLRPEVKGF